MILIAILFCLALQRFAKMGGWFHASWFEGYLGLLNPWLSKLDERLIILLVIAPILLLFVLLHFIFAGWFFDLFDLILATTVLFFCIDARDLKYKLKPYFEAMEKSDMHSASDAVADFISDVSIGNIADLSRAVTKAVFLKSFERVFVGLFWFVAFGIYGVATYSLVVLLRQNALKVNPNYIELAKSAAKVQEILEWLPARLLGFTYALVGHFNKGFNYDIKHLWSGLSEVKKFAVDSGLAALDVSNNVSDADKSENYAALDIVNRVLIIWIMAVILIFLGLLL
ncbi:MAG: regulatory signaling modulator protein AmpE [Gammaproteobacteria bacterium]|nr:regulatory signaling modulator protein AmpE [Gammaproteobacteria bacterium]